METTMEKAIEMPSKERIEAAMKNTATMARFVLETASTPAQKSCAERIREALAVMRQRVDARDALGAFTVLRSVQLELKSYPHG